MGHTVTLPESLTAFIDTEVSSRGHADAAGYIQELLLKEIRHRQAREKVEVLLEEGLNSGEPVEWTPQLLESLKGEILERQARRDGKGL